MASDHDPDLSQLVVLEALLLERHVTRAAARVGITQSSMSHQLALLRARLGDPILVRAGRAMALTPRAEALAEPLRHALATLRRVMSDAGVFEPATSTRSFSLACPDVLAPLIPELLAAMAVKAPGVRLDVIAPAPALASALASGACDVALGPTPASAPGVVLRALGAVRWCVLAREGHPMGRRGLTLARWSAHPHVVVRQGDGGPNRIGNAIERAGVARTVGVTVPSFLAAPWVVARSDMFFTAPRELVGDIARALGLRMHAPPVALAPIQVAAMWHERMAADAGHRWFRDVVVAALSKRLRARATP